MGSGQSQEIIKVTLEQKQKNGIHSMLTFSHWQSQPARSVFVVTSARLFSCLFVPAIFSIALSIIFSLPLSQLLLPAWAAPAAKESTKKGWRLSQESTTGGTTNSVITDDAIKMESLTCGFTMIAKAPDWNICVFRPETKEMGFLKFSQWHAWNMSTVGATDECTLEKAISKRKVQVPGIKVPAFQYKFPGEKMSTTILQTERPIEVSNFYADAYQLSKAPQVWALQCQLFNCQVLDGVLIRCLGRVVGKKDLCWFIHTNRLERDESIPSSTFSIPKGYRTLKSINNQFKFKGMAGAIDEFGEMLDLGKARQIKPAKSK